MRKRKSYEHTGNRHRHHVHLHGCVSGRRKENFSEQKRFKRVSSPGRLPAGCGDNCQKGAKSAEGGIRLSFRCGRDLHTDAWHCLCQRERRSGDAALYLEGRMRKPSLSRAGELCGISFPNDGISHVYRLWKRHPFLSAGNGENTCGCAGVRGHRRLSGHASDGQYPAQGE